MDPLTPDQLKWQQSTLLSAFGRDGPYPPVKTRNIQTDGILYLSQMNTCADCDIVLYLHGGFFYDFTRFSLTPFVSWLGDNFEVEVHSLGFRLPTHGGSLDDTLADITRAVEWLHWEYPGRKVVAVGSSSGASYLLHWLHQPQPPSASLELAFVDSGMHCQDNVLDDASNTFPIDSKLQLSRVVMDLDRVYDNKFLRGANCTTGLSAPTIALHGGQDQFAPKENAERCADLDNCTVCIPPAGEHLFAFGTPCTAFVFDHLKLLGFVPQPQWKLSLSQVNILAQESLASFAQSMGTSGTCLYVTDPIIREILEC